MSRHFHAIACAFFVCTFATGQQARQSPLGEVVQHDQAKRKIAVKFADRLKVYTYTADAKLYFDEHKADWAAIEAGHRVRVDADDRSGMIRIARAQTHIPPPALEKMEEPDVIVPKSEKGDTGRISIVTKVFQVVGDRAVILDMLGELLYVEDFDTTGLVDGRQFKSDSLFTVVGTKRYATVTGATKTIPLLKPESNEQREARQKRMVEIAKANLAKEEEHKARIAALEARRKKGLDAQSANEQKAKASADEVKAAAVLNGAKLRLKTSDRAGAEKRLKELIEKYPGTAAAVEGEKMLREIE